MMEQGANGVVIQVQAMSSGAIMAKIIATSVRDLQTVVSPSINGAEAEDALTMAIRHLEFLAAWLGGMDERCTELDTQLQSLLTNFEVPGTLPSEQAITNEFAMPTVPPAFAATIAKAGQRIEEGASDITALETGARDVEQAFYGAEAEVVQAIMPGAISLRHKTEVEFTIERLQEFVDEKSGGGTVRSISKIPGGYSKDTYMAQLSGVCGYPDNIVIRRDLPFGPGENTVLDEFELLQNLYDANFQIAKPLASEADTKYLGQPFIVMDRISGASGSDVWQNDKQFSQEICSQLAAFLGRLHSSDPSDFGFKSVGSPKEQVEAYVLEWRDRWYRHRRFHSPILSSAFSRLLSNIPTNLSRTSIIHGDVGFHNILTDSGRITAVLDWEFAHLGDAAEDIGYCRQHVEPLCDWSLFLSDYEQAGGFVSEAGNARFYEVWRAIRNCVSCLVSWNGFLLDEYPAQKMAYQGIHYFRHFLADLAVQLKQFD